MDEKEIQQLFGAVGATSGAEIVAKFDAAVTEINTLKTERDQLLSDAQETGKQLSAVQASLDEIKEQRAVEARDGLIKALSQEGKLSPAMAAGWATTQTYDQLKAFGEAAEPIAPRSPAASEPRHTEAPAGAAEGGVQLSDADRQVAELLELDDSEMLESAKFLSTQENFWVCPAPSRRELAKERKAS